MTSAPPSAPANASSETAVDSSSGILNLIRAISLTAVGLGALSSYFFHIDYFPLFDLQAASSYLFAVTLVLAVLLTLVACCLLVPYIFIGTTLTPPKTGNKDQKLSAAIFIWMIFSMLALASWSAAFILTIAQKWHALWGPPIAVGFISLLCGVRTHFHVRKIKKKYSGSVVGLWKKNVVRKLFFRQLGIAFLNSFLQLAPLSMLFLIFSQASGVPEHDYLNYFSISVLCAFFIAIVGAILLHVVLIPRFRKYWWFALGLVLLLPFWLTALSEATGMLPMTMARMTKIGNFRAEKLVLAPKACGSIAPILGIDCDEKTSPPIQLCNVHIMSRIGPETYLHIAGKTASEDTTAGGDRKQQVRRVFIPTADITSMQVNFDPKIERLSQIDMDLSSRSFACEKELTTLHADSAFGFNDFELTESGKTQLLIFIEAVKNGSAAIQEVKVTGHADQIGHDTRNAWLAERRMQEVKLLMETRLKNTSPPIRITALSKGSTDPLTKACGALSREERIKCEAPNRRVEVEIIRKRSVEPR